MRGIYITILCVLSLIAIEGYFDFYKEAPLNGAYDKVQRPTFSISSWFDGSFQQQQGKYINENIGFGNTLIRLSNQLNYSIFGVAKASGVCVGKEGYLFEEGYINTFFGRDYLGRKKIEEYARKTKFVQDKLKLRKIDLVIAFAPSKGAFYSEYIPESMMGEETEEKNYTVFSSTFKERGINTIDFYKWFLEMKEGSKYPLYPKTGIHWSTYGEILAGDSLLNYLEGVTGKNLNKIVIDSIEISSVVKANEKDIERGMNLLFDISNITMGYPKHHLEKGTQAIKGMVLADSYYWGLFNKGFSKHLSDGQFWYYNEEIHQYGIDKKAVDEVNVKEEVERNQVIIILTTSMNLHRFSFGFIDELYDLYDLGEKEEYNDRVRLYEKKIRNTEVWLNQLKEQANERQLNLDSFVLQNAKYMVWKDDQP